jgi:hypothetical protein
MQAHGTAIPAGQAWPPTVPADARPLAAASGDDELETSPGRRSAAGVHHVQEHLTPRSATTLDRRAEGAGTLRSSSGRTRKDGPARWLTVSMVSLAALAAASATVSYAAQYRMVFAAKAVAPVAALEAAIPDVAALIFATLGIALALHGRRAVRARVLNVAAVVTSVAMNVLAAGRGWRDLVIWAMPPVAYALASDTAIGVVRAWTLARQRATGEALTGDEATPLAIVGGLLLWLLRLAVAPVSTLAGFRSWVVEECPVAPGRHGLRTRGGPQAVTAARPVTAITGSPAVAARRGGARRGTKTAQFLALVAGRYGPLEAFPLADVSRVSTELAPKAGLDPGAARSALRRHVQSLQNGSSE